MKSIAKNFGKLNQVSSPYLRYLKAAVFDNLICFINVQLVGEKLYSSSVNKHELTEEFKLMESQLDIRKQGTDMVLQSCNKFLYTMEKRKEGLDKNKHLPIANLGLAMSQYGFELANLVADESDYGQALLKMGAAEMAIADLQEEFAKKLRDSFVSKLEAFMADLKHYKYLRGKLQNRRLDYDAKANKIQKAKKEKPDLDEDMRNAQQKYEETLLELEHLMISLSDREGPQLEGLFHFAEAQIEYHKAAMIQAEKLKILLQDPNAKVEPVAVSSEAPSITVTSISSNDVTPSQEKSSHYSNLTAASVVKSNALIAQSTNALSLLRQSHQRSMLSDHTSRYREHVHVRVLYEYKAQHSDELTIQEADIITVLNDEIDAGWWIGQLNNVRGIFPVAYTEPITQQQIIHNQSRKHKISEDCLTSGGESTDMSRINSLNRLPHSSSWPKVVEDSNANRPDIVTTSFSNVSIDDKIYETPFLHGSDSNTNLIERQ